MLPCPIGHYRRIGQRIGQKKTQIFKATFAKKKQRKSPEIFRFQDFLVETAGLEPVTSCV